MKMMITRRSNRLQALAQRSRNRTAADSDPDGFLVLRKIVEPTAQVVAEIRDLVARRGIPIFNGSGAASKSKRFQTPPIDTMRVSPALTAFVDSIEYVAIQHYPRLRFSHAAGLLSRPGCGEQPVHCDYDVEDLAPLDDRDTPRGMLVALEDDTRLVVYPGSHRLWSSVDGKGPVVGTWRHTLQLDAGDVCFFRGDLLHAGATYTKQNVRIHAYLDSELAPRMPGRTWLLSRERPDVNQSVVGEKKKRLVC
jgi:ectoine hydroxylase-related dioxygenase (phytanoyl-CoA dioxygenase family)